MRFFSYRLYSNFSDNEGNDCFYFQHIRICLHETLFWLSLVKLLSKIIQLTANKKLLKNDALRNIK